MRTGLALHRRQSRVYAELHAIQQRLGTQTAPIASPEGNLPCSRCGQMEAAALIRLSQHGWCGQCIAASRKGGIR